MVAALAHLPVVAALAPSPVVAALAQLPVVAVVVSDAFTSDITKFTASAMIVGNPISALIEIVAAAIFESSSWRESDPDNSTEQNLLLPFSG